MRNTKHLTGLLKLKLSLDSNLGCFQPLCRPANLANRSIASTNPMRQQGHSCSQRFSLAAASGPVTVGFYDKKFQKKSNDAAVSPAVEGGPGIVNSRGWRGLGRVLATAATPALQKRPVISRLPEPQLPSFLIVAHLCQ